MKLEQVRPCPEGSTIGDQDYNCQVMLASLEIGDGKIVL